MGEHVGAVGDLQCELHVLLDEQHRVAELVGERRTTGSRRSTIDRREAQAHLVEQEHPRAATSARADREHLLLAARQEPGPPRAQLAQRREILEAPRRRGARRGAEAQVLGDGEAENSQRPSGTSATPRARQVAGAIAPCRRRRRRSARSSGRRRPEIVSSVVVLPAPLAPSSATTSPAPT